MKIAVQPLFGDQYVTEAVTYPSSPQRKKATSVKCASSSIPQRTPCLRAGATILKAKELVKAVRKQAKTKGTLSTVDSDVYCGFADFSDPNVLLWIAQYAEEVWIQSGKEGSIEMLLSVQEYSSTVTLEQYDHLAPFLYAALIPTEQLAYMAGS